MKQPDFDVIIAGAGAGGAAAACYLTQAGLRVLVIEKARLPRYKPCGGAIPRRTVERLPVAVDGVIRTVPTEVRFTFPGLPPVDAALPGDPVVMVRRSEFDAALLSRSGAEVLEGTAISGLAETAEEVRIEAGGRRLTGRYLVGADGAVSRVAHWLGLPALPGRPGRRRRQLGGAVEAEIPLEGDWQAGPRAPSGAGHSQRALFAIGAVPWGYGWVFPRGDCLSVGVGRFCPGRVDLRTALHREMARLGIPLREAQIHGHPIPTYQAGTWWQWCGPSRLTPQERLATRRCLLVGDAAGLVDPLIGEGIRHAITSARLAAEAIQQGDLSGYEQRVWHEIGHNLATAGLIARLFYRWPRRCYEMGIRNPATLRLFVDLLVGDLNYQGMGRRLIASTARWLLTR